MSLEMPSELDWLFKIVAGQAWPKGDEDKLRELGRAWTEFSNSIQEISGEFEPLFNLVTGNLSGQPAEAFAQFVTQMHKQLPALVDAGKQITKLSNKTAQQTEYSKYMIIGQLVLLAAELAWAAANAFWTFGASEALVPGFVAATRLTVTMILRRLAMAILMGVVSQVALDVAIQTIQAIKAKLNGDDFSWNWANTGSAAEMGAIGGALGGGIGMGLSKFKTTGFGDKFLGQLITGGATGLGMTEISNLMNGDDANLGYGLTSGLAGALGGGGKRGHGGGSPHMGDIHVGDVNTPKFDAGDFNKPNTSSDFTPPATHSEDFNFGNGNGNHSGLEGLEGSPPPVGGNNFANTGNGNNSSHGSEAPPPASSSGSQNNVPPPAENTGSQNNSGAQNNVPPPAANTGSQGAPPPVQHQDAPPPVQQGQDAPPPQAPSRGGSSSSTPPPSRGSNTPPVQQSTPPRGQGSQTPPPSHETPPQAQQTPPAEHAAPPVQQSTETSAPPPVQHTQTPPPEQATPPAQHQTPPAQHAAPPVQQSAPPVQHVAPPVQHSAPPVEHAAPPVQHATPPAEHSAPPVQSTPAAQHQSPPAEHQSAPPVEHQNTPVEQHQTPPPAQQHSSDTNTDNLGGVRTGNTSTSSDAGGGPARAPQEQPHTQQPQQSAPPPMMGGQHDGPVTDNRGNNTTTGGERGVSNTPPPSRGTTNTPTQPSATPPPRGSDRPVTVDHTPKTDAPKISTESNLPRDNAPVTHDNTTTDHEPVTQHEAPVQQPLTQQAPPAPHEPPAQHTPPADNTPVANHTSAVVEHTPPAEHTPPVENAPVVNHAPPVDHTPAAPPPHEAAIEQPVPHNETPIPHETRTPQENPVVPPPMGVGGDHHGGPSNNTRSTPERETASPTPNRSQPSDNRPNTRGNDKPDAAPKGRDDQNRTAPPRPKTESGDRHNEPNPVTSRPAPSFNREGDGNPPATHTPAAQTPAPHAAATSHVPPVDHGPSTSHDQTTHDQPAHDNNTGHHDDGPPPAAPHITPKLAERTMPEGMYTDGERRMVDQMADGFADKAGKWGDPGGLDLAKHLADRLGDEGSKDLAAKMGHKDIDPEIRKQYADELGKRLVAQHLADVHQTAEDLATRMKATSDTAKALAGGNSKLDGPTARAVSDHVVNSADRVVAEAVKQAVRMVGAPDHPWSVVAVGSYGRKELGPASDLDFSVVGDVPPGSRDHAHLQLIKDTTSDLLNLGREHLMADPNERSPHGKSLFEADTLWLDTHADARPGPVANTSRRMPGDAPNAGVVYDSRPVHVDGVPNVDNSHGTPVHDQMKNAIGNVDRNDRQNV
ncbi:MAG TPA: DUF294 nucleotidyltransferase-like domain-containing protein, partial [Kutzneria sp.]|nr:DUF294 nucleotidyltransferase-like domain-containing protein [Kutzneria sp.]